MKITANINRDKETREYKVRLFIDGKHQAAADYHTDDLDDARDTAKAMVAQAETRSAKAAKAAAEAKVSRGNKDMQRKARIKDGIQTLLRKLETHSLVLTQWEQTLDAGCEKVHLRLFLAKKVSSAKRKKYATQVGINTLLKRL